MAGFMKKVPKAGKPRKTSLGTRAMLTVNKAAKAARTYGYKKYRKG